MHRIHGFRVVVGGIATCLAVAPVFAQTDGARDVPARTLPIPSTVSPEIQRALATPIPEPGETKPNGQAG